MATYTYNKEYGFFKIIRQTKCYIFIKKYRTIQKYYNDFVKKELYNYYIFTNEIDDDDEEIKIFKKNYNEENNREYKINNYDYYEPINDEIKIINDNDFFYIDEDIKRFCCLSKLYLHNILIKDHIHNNNIIQSIRDAYRLVNFSFRKDYIKEWMRRNTKNNEEDVNNFFLMLDNKEEKKEEKKEITKERRDEIEQEIEEITHELETINKYEEYYNHLFNSKELTEEKEKEMKKTLLYNKNKREKIYNKISQLNKEIK